MIHVRKEPVAVYPYHDAVGRVVYQLYRYVPKDFAWATPSGASWKRSARRPLLYRLPKLLAADPALPVYVVEGEKDADRLCSLGLVATCNDGGGGRGKWSRAHSLPLRGRSVIILPDNDRTGEEHAQNVAQQLSRLAASIRVLNLPGLPRKGDVSDWLDSGGTLEELANLSAAAIPWTPGPPALRLSRDFTTYDLVWTLESIVPARISPIEKLLLIILASLNWPRSRLSQQDLAIYLGVSQRRIRQLVAGLKERGLLQVHRHGRNNHYSVHTGRLDSLSRT